MHLSFPMVISAVVLIFGLIQILFFRFLNPLWWQRKLIRRAAWGLPLFGVLNVSLWALGEYHTTDWLAYPGAILAVLTFICEIALILALPVSGLIHFARWGLDKLAARRKSISEANEVDTARRRLLKSAAAAVPLLALAGGAGGVVRAQGNIKVFKKTILIKNLPPALDGFRIFHLSDLHLRHYVTLDDVVDVLEEGKQYNPDITLVTGDIADDLKVLPDTLRLIDQFKTPLGSYATLGNHEYFRGIGEVLAIFERAPVPLLVDQGIRLSYRGESLFIGGIDDPRSMGAKEVDFFRNRIDKTLTNARESDFVILMSHRPDALDYAVNRNIPLVLAGHTHGGQIGFDNRSVFESVWPDRYLWGEYRINNTHLYTTCGMGHWFPFRLGCPPEAPIIELKRA